MEGENGGSSFAIVFCSHTPSQRDQDTQGRTELFQENSQGGERRRRGSRAVRQGGSALLTALFLLTHTKIFNHDVKRLLQMEDMWKTRTPPTPLDFESALTATTHATDSGSTHTPISDQRQMTLGDNVQLFIDATNRLSARSRSTNMPIEFDKDDKDTLDFVTAASNLRSVVYGIPPKTLFEVKEMAGNIIPAIATTNAIIAGVQTLKAINVLNGQMDLCRPSVYLGSQLIAAPFEAPNKECSSCQDVYVPLPIKTEEVTLGEFIDVLRSVVDVYKDGARELSVFEKERLLYDPDFDDNLEKKLGELGCQSNTFITVVDEDGKVENVTMVLAPMDGSEKFTLPASIKQPGKKYKPEPVKEPSHQPASRKRGRDDDTDTNTYTEDANGVVSINDSDDEDGEPPAKKMHADGPITLDDSDEEVVVKEANNKTISLDD